MNCWQHGACPRRHAPFKFEDDIGTSLMRFLVRTISLQHDSGVVEDDSGRFCSGVKDQSFPTHVHNLTSPSPQRSQTIYTKRSRRMIAQRIERRVPQPTRPRPWCLICPPPNICFAAPATQQFTYFSSQMILDVRTC